MSAPDPYDSSRADRGHLDGTGPSQCAPCRVGGSSRSCCGSVEEPVRAEPRDDQVEEGSYLGRRVASFRVENVDRKRRLFVIAERNLEVAVEKVRADLVVEHSRETPAGLRSGDCGVVGIAQQAGVHDDALIALEPPL